MFFGNTFLAIYLYFALYRFNHVLTGGMRVVFVGIALMLFRMIIPINFPFNIDLYFDKVLPTLTRWIYMSIGNTGLDVSDILIRVWFVGVVFKISVLIRKNYYMHKNLKPFLVDKDIKRKVCKGCLTEKEIQKVDLALLPKQIAPAIIGIFNPIIMMPMEGLEECERQHVLKHEIEHYRRHDLWLKFILEIAECTQWCNPIFYLLKKEFNLAMEILNDSLVIKEFSEEEKMQYASCVMNIAKQVENAEPVLALEFIGKSSSNLKLRIEFILKEHHAERKKVATYLHTIIIVMATVVTLMIVPEADIPPSENEPGVVTITPENTYFIDKGMEYDVYVDGKFFAPISKEDVSFIEGYEKTKVYQEANKR